MKVVLPIGTIVVLKNVDYYVMVIGFYQESVLKYIGVIYPIGFVPLNQNICFEKNQIETVVFFGYIHSFHETFSTKLRESITNEVMNNDI